MWTLEKIVPIFSLQYIYKVSGRDLWKETLQLYFVVVALSTTRQESFTSIIFKRR